MTALKLMVQIEALPPDLQMEVADFVEFLTVKAYKKQQRVLPNETSDDDAPTTQMLDLSAPIFKPMRPKLVLEDLIKEQDYKGMNTERMNKIIKKMDINEPVDVLLSQLTA